MLPSNTRKAITPITASMILLCIAIAVTLATIAWINGLPNPDTPTEELHIANYHWGPNYAYIEVTLQNLGTQSISLSSVTVNSQPASTVYITGSKQIDTGESAVLRVSGTFTSGETYQITFQTTRGNKFNYTATA
jgi:FlaG/FlaF family flagellin (archaellin)